MFSITIFLISKTNKINRTKNRSNNFYNIKKNKQINN